MLSVIVTVGVVVLGVLLISMMWGLGKNLIVPILLSRVVVLPCRSVLGTWASCTLVLVLGFARVVIVLVCPSVMCTVLRLRTSSVGCAGLGCVRQWVTLGFPRTTVLVGLCRVVLLSGWLVRWLVGCVYFAWWWRR